MTHSELASGIRNAMFADRDSIGEAYSYVLELAKNSRDSAALLTAVHVMLNSVANAIDKIEEAQSVA